MGRTGDRQLFLLVGEVGRQNGEHGSFYPQRGIDLGRSMDSERELISDLQKGSFSESLVCGWASWDAGTN
jgi:hypothetical protein